MNGLASQTPAVNDINAAVIACRHLLEEFFAKVQKYNQSSGVDRSRGKFKDAGRKIQWAYWKKEEVERLRTCLNVHVGAINMHLLRLGIEAHTRVTEEARTHRQALIKDIKETKDDLKEIRGDIKLQTIAATESRSIAQTLLALVCAEIVAPLKAIIANLNVISYVPKDYVVTYIDAESDTEKQ